MKWFLSDFLRSCLKLRSIYFHEDNCCQQELLPRSAPHFGTLGLEELTKVTGEMKLSTLKIGIDDLHSLISPHLPRFDQVWTGYGSQREKAKRTSAWGLSDDCSIFADSNEDHVVVHIWCSFFGGSEKSISAISRSLNALSQKYALVYVDWARGYVCDLSDQRNFIAKLQEKSASI